MPPKRGRGKANSANKRAKKELTDEEKELLTQTITVLAGFFRASMDQVGGDDDVEFENDELSLVHGKSFYDLDESRDEEILVISRTDGENYTARLIEHLRPLLVEEVNKIVEAANAYISYRNESPVDQDDIKNFLKVYLNPKIRDTCHRADEEEQGVRKGCLGFRRRSGNSLSRGRWNYQEPIDEASLGPKKTTITVPLLQRISSQISVLYFQ